MKIRNYFLAILFTFSLSSLFAQVTDIEKGIFKFENNYAKQLDEVERRISYDSLNNCTKIEIVSEKLRKDNYPAIIHFNKKTENVIILFHGLSDSPYYMKSIADYFVKDSINVVLSLLPGHGLLEPDMTMEDDSLKEKWRKEVANSVEVAALLGNKISLAGFSTGGALAIDYILDNKNKINGGLFLFSAAVGLDSWTEFKASIPCLSKWIAKLDDGEYSGKSENPYKYKKISAFGGIALVEIIDAIRTKNEKQKIELPLFIAHSINDVTAIFKDIKDFYQINGSAKVIFEFNDKNVKHGNLVLKDDIKVNGKIVAKKNPKFLMMMDELDKFYKTNIK